MPPKGIKPTNDELLAQFDDLGVDTETDQQPTSRPAATVKSEQDILAELDSLAAQRPSSGHGTPQVSSKSPKLTSDASSSGRPSEEKTTVTSRSEENGRTSHSDVEFVPSAAEKKLESSGGGWWGGILSTATAAMKQAEAAVKEIQKNEEAQKWAEQVRGNVGALRDLGGELRTLAIPTFTSIIHTLAPPISSHERLQIHITHDLSGYPSLDSLIYSVFSRVMSQVEGGDLLVIQRGQEFAPRRSSDHGGYHASTAGWNDGPWWRTVTPGNPRSISAVRGATEASKLARASAEAYATEFYVSKGGVEEAAKQATTALSETNPVRNSDIFLAIQAVSQTASTDLFQAGPTTEKPSPPGVVEVADDNDEEVCFAIYLHDPIHGIAFCAMSQPVPQKWIDWLDAAAPAAADADDENANIPLINIPEAIAEVIEGGGVDPREWVAEWVEESLSLAVGIVAQRYVARRMGVCEGGVGKGKMKAEVATTIDSGAGEAARAV